MEGNCLMKKASVYVVVRVDFDGDYYFPEERPGLVEDWIGSALYDRDDVTGFKVMPSWQEEG